MNRYGTDITAKTERSTDANCCSGNEASRSPEGLLRLTFRFFRNIIIAVFASDVGLVSPSFNSFIRQRAN
jgi:hypothetical protein